MREIKFRAWTGQKMLHAEDLSTAPEHRGWLGHYDYQLLQYTGMKDRDGYEIYDGDIVVELGMVKEATWTEEGAGWVFIPRRQFDNNYSASVTIIGNIYENPELLEKETP